MSKTSDMHIERAAEIEATIAKLTEREVLALSGKLSASEYCEVASSMFGDGRMLGVVSFDPLYSDADPLKGWRLTSHGRAVAQAVRDGGDHA